MHVDDIFTKAHAAGKIPVSFEMFPPKGELTLDKARDAAKKLSAYGPDFISVTCSAGGGRQFRPDRRHRLDARERVQRQLCGAPYLHFAHAGRAQERIAQYKAAGVENVLALRGDRPTKDSPLYGAPSDFSFAAQIIPALIEAGFCVGGAAYPEGHIECESLETSVEHLKLKQDAGASFFVTQLFFDNEYCYRFLDLAEKAASRCPSPAESCPL